MARILGGTVVAHQITLDVLIITVETLVHHLPTLVATRGEESTPLIAQVDMTTPPPLLGEEVTGGVHLLVLVDEVIMTHPEDTGTIVLDRTGLEEEAAPLLGDHTVLGGDHQGTVRGIGEVLDLLTGVASLVHLGGAVVDLHPLVGEVQVFLQDIVQGIVEAGAEKGSSREQGVIAVLL